MIRYSKYTSKCDRCKEDLEDCFEYEDNMGLTTYGFYRKNSLHGAFDKYFTEDEFDVCDSCIMNSLDYIGDYCPDTYRKRTKENYKFNI